MSTALRVLVLAVALAVLHASDTVSNARYLVLLAVPALGAIWWRSGPWTPPESQEMRAYVERLVAAGAPGGKRGGGPLTMKAWDSWTGAQRGRYLEHMAELGRQARLTRDAGEADSKAAAAATAGGKGGGGAEWQDKSRSERYAAAASLPGCRLCGVTTGGMMADKRGLTCVACTRRSLE